MGLFANLFEGLTMPKMPLHVGEVMILWTGMAALDEGRIINLTLLNQTSDPELKRFIEHYIKELGEPHQKHLATFLREEGVQHPPCPPDPPKVDPLDVPPGAKFTDAEIANILAFKLVAALQICQNGLLQTIRNDVAEMLLNTQADLMRHALALKGLMHRRGWLKIPPFYIPSKIES